MQGCSLNVKGRILAPEHVLYLPRLSSCLQNEGDNHNSCLLEGAGGIKCDHLHEILRSVPGQDEPSKKKKINYYSIPHLA